MTTVVVIDDDPGFRDRVSTLLTEGGFEVIGHAGDVVSAREVIASQRPAVALIDVGLPDGDGLALAAELTGPAAPRVIVMSGRDQVDFGPRIGRSGAAGFIPKSHLTAAAVWGLLAAVTR